MINAVQSTGNVVSVFVFMKLISNHFIFDYFLNSSIANDGQIKKYVKREVSEIEDEIVDDSNESGENFSTENSEEEVTDDVQNSTTENNYLVTLNLDPFQTPKDEIVAENTDEPDINTTEHEINTEDELSPTKPELNTEPELSATIPSIEEGEINNEESTTVSTGDETSDQDEVFIHFVNNGQINEV